MAKPSTYIVRGDVSTIIFSSSKSIISTFLSESISGVVLVAPSLSTDLAVVSIAVNIV